MPSYTRAFIKSGMLFFILSLLTGVLIEGYPDLTLYLRPLFWHMLMAGWITQIIIGVSLWMFPGRSRVENLRSAFLPWSIFFTLNLGLVLRIIFEPFAVTETILPVSVALMISAVLQMIAAFTYFTEMWPRVLSKEKQRTLRQQKKREEGK